MCKNRRLYAPPPFQRYRWLPILIKRIERDDFYHIGHDVFVGGSGNAGTLNL